MEKTTWIAYYLHHSSIFNQQSVRIKSYFYEYMVLNTVSAVGEISCLNEISLHFS